ncbi:MAG: hypothetical protein ABSF12_14075 [Bryobacteraceae bacterium]|jgi:hypothetical protein
MAPVLDKQQAHDLIDRLQPEQVPAAVSFLRSMLAFPVEDEPVSEEERQAVLKAEAWLKEHGGRGIPMEEVLADFGLTMDDFPLKDHGSDPHD